MHLKAYPKLVLSELRLDACSSVQTSQHSGVFVSRLPLTVLSTNTLRCSTTTNLAVNGSVRLKAVPGMPTLQLLPPPPGCENDTLRLYQTVTEDADTKLDIWTVIKPGHVREKIAIFASDGKRSDGTRSRERTSAGSPDSRDRTVHGAALGPLRAGKAKGSWEENSSAKRRRRSGNHQNLQQDPRTCDMPRHKPSPHRSDTSQRLCGGPDSGGSEEVTSAEEEEQQKVSVVEMVAFLEQRASEQQPDAKPLLAVQRSSTTITLSRAPLPEIRGEEPESVRVLDMVAKLESECLRRRAEGDLSRSNSLRRSVGRVLLAAAGDQSSAPCQPSPPQLTTSSSSLTGAEIGAREPISCSETAALATPPSGEVLSTEAPPFKLAPPSPSEEAEPVPGLLFLSPEPCPHTDFKPRPPSHRTTSDLEPAPTKPRPPHACSDCGSQSEKRRRRRADRAEEEEEAGPALVTRRAPASQDFLLMRQLVQQLLEPTPFLAALPHHLLLKVLQLLPTQSLAALKCTCTYFKFVIDTYGVRPADSLWVSDPRYRDDPCKQCKKRYGRGDVSLCRWHHKPYCQALPYGPGYWMCCHGARRDAPGCNVGLHDNRWVPSFHSINVPIYRRGRHDN
ncbi:F-box only protein 34 [Centropristis striata]|uniref:F-box only protein 34 n=1 Tax=Centropristis striata TaxID=184440 RepID=UPI0027DFE54A|nr:F-box only protein 34 [Centropristis striata]XP_059208767.1 F-box only protein 34 [Centropristis striata]